MFWSFPVVQQESCHGITPPTPFTPTHRAPREAPLLPYPVAFLSLHLFSVKANHHSSFISFHVVYGPSIIFTPVVVG
uniref:Uncharacterized protein n=1 Tax=Physcomitrium patens TaxID=3218 RepID=A0A7I3Z7W7_PHYPA